MTVTGTFITEINNYTSKTVKLLKIAYSAMPSKKQKMSYAMVYCATTSFQVGHLGNHFQERYILVAIFYKVGMKVVASSTQLFEFKVENFALYLIILNQKN